jgi:hypothetical protein
MFISRARLLSDIGRWQAQGYVTEQGAAEIRRDLDSRTTGAGPTGALAVLGAILLGFAAMSFIAANWAALSKLAKLTLIFGGIATCYGAAFELFRRKLDVFAHAAVLAGVALFGGAIMLIAQMYHMDGHPPDAVWPRAGRERRADLRVEFHGDRVGTQTNPLGVPADVGGGCWRYCDHALGQGYASTGSGAEWLDRGVVPAV